MLIIFAICVAISNKETRHLSFMFIQCYMLTDHLA